jgi:Neuraminidase (sialidase)
VTFGPNGIVYAISISFDGGIQAPGSDSAVLASRSLDGGRTWSSPSTLIIDGADFFNDKETITADPNIPNFVYAVWDRLPPQGGGPAVFARSEDGGATWEAPRSIYDPGTASQTLGNEIVVLPNGNLVDLFTRIDTAPGGSQTAKAMVIRSTDQGTTWSAPTQVADLFAVGARDPKSGTGVRDGADLPQMAVGPTGVLFTTWADGRFSGGARDGIALSHSADGGLTWSAPVRMNGDASAEAFEPGVHVRNDGTITVTYFDFRNDTTAADLPTILWLARSNDAVNWRESAIAGPFDLENAPFAQGLFIGDYQGLSSLGSVSEPFFVQTNNGSTSNRTDVFSAPAVSVTTMFNLMVRAMGVTAQPAQPFVLTADFRKRVSDNLSHVMERREVEWRNAIRKRQGLPPLQDPERD